MTELQKQEVIKLRKEELGFKAIARKLSLTRDQVRGFCNSVRGRELGISGQKGKIAEKQPKKCVWCNREHFGEVGYKYCSDECKASAKKERARISAEERIKRMTVNCPTCGKQFVKRSNSQVYCNNECRYEIRTCERCGGEYRIRRDLETRTCSKACAREIARKSHEDYFKEFNEIHKGWLSLLESYTKSDDDIEVKCLRCGNIFSQRAERFIYKPKPSRCQNCNRSNSRGEERIAKWLSKNEIDYKQNQTFDDLKNEDLLSYDFAIYNNDGIEKLIEYHGRQHYEPIEFMGGVERYNKQILHDSMKRNYAKKNKIELIEISYKQYSKIEKILERNICRT